MTHKHMRIALSVLLALLLASGIAACAPETPTAETVQPMETGITNLPGEEATSTPLPTASPELPVVMLVAGTDADPGTVDRVQSILEELAAESSLGLVVKQGLEGDMLDSNVRILAGISLNLDPAALAGTNPGTAFVLIDQAGAASAANLSVIGDPMVDQQRQSFMAGYLAALVSSDYKVAGLIPAGNPLSEIMTDAFVVGAEFFCGVCNPLYPPFENYPQWESLSAEEAADGFQPVVDALVIKGVEVLYVQSQLATSEMLTYLAGTTLKIVGDGMPDTARNNWVGTVTTDPGPALIELWPDLLAGSGGVQLPSAITLTDTEAGLISEGRLRMFVEMAEDLEAGLVSPVTGP